MPQLGQPDREEDSVEQGSGDIFHTLVSAWHQRKRSRKLLRIHFQRSENKSKRKQKYYTAQKKKVIAVISVSDSYEKVLETKKGEII